MIPTAHPGAGPPLSRLAREQCRRIAAGDSSARPRGARLAGDPAKRGGACRTALPASSPDERCQPDEADARVVAQRDDVIERLGLAVVDEQEEAVTLERVAGGVELL